MNVDGAPTIFCFHASVRRRGRRGEPAHAGNWAPRPGELRLPGGKVLRSDDVLQAGGDSAA